MKRKVHYKKPLILDNCKYLKNLKVLLPEELFCIQDKLKEEFKNIEKFYEKFLKTKKFANDLTIVLYLENKMVRTGVFYPRTGKEMLPEIKVYNATSQLLENEIGRTLVHEFAHYIDWKLGEQSKQYGSYKSEQKGSKENKLAELFKTLQEKKPMGIPVGGSSSTDELSGPVELYARFLEEYYIYCFKREVWKNKFNLKMNTLYVKRKDFEKKLCTEIGKYLDYDTVKLTRQRKKIFEDGILYSNDRKILLKYDSNSRRKKFFIPDTVITIGRSAFSGSKNLKKIEGGKNVKIISWGAFMNCRELEEAVGFNSLEIIDNNAFSGCKKLNTFSISNSLHLINSNAFLRCNMLDRNVIREKVKYVGKSYDDIPKK